MVAQTEYPGKNDRAAFSIHAPREDWEITGRSNPSGPSSMGSSLKSRFPDVLKTI
jgi:hypothetical protein